jgi:hypothetical protein
MESGASRKLVRCGELVCRKGTIDAEDLFERSGYDGVAIVASALPVTRVSIAECNARHFVWLVLLTGNE